MLEVGCRGEHVAQIIEKLGSQIVPKLRQMDYGGNEEFAFVKAQTEGWLSRIVRKVDINTEAFAGTDIISLSFRNDGASPSYSPYDPAASCCALTTNMPTPRRRRAEPCVLNRICEALEVDRGGFYRGTRPATYVGFGINAPNMPRNKAASGQLAANASLIRLAVSPIRTAIFSNRSRMVENSPLASGYGRGIAPRTVSISQ